MQSAILFQLTHKSNDSRVWLLNSNISKILKLIAILVLAINVICLPESCGQRSDLKDIASAIRQNCTFDINGFILDKLRNDRIVMLADAEHGSSLYLQSVSNFLKYWVENLARSNIKNDNVPRKLFLFMEMAPDEGARLQKFIVSGKVFESFTYKDIMWGMNTARLEYYNDLREIRSRIDSANSTLAADKQIEFDLLFPEKAVDTNVWSKARADSFFIRGRDEYSSQQIIDSLNAQPDYKALVFYGSGHLNKFKTLKRGNIISGEGYYMAYYLARQFNKQGRLCTIYQSTASSSGEMSGLCRDIGWSFAIDFNTLKTNMIPKDAQRAGADGEIIYFGFSPDYKEIPLHQIHSLNLIKYLVANLQGFSVVADTMNQNFFRNDLRALIALTGIDFGRFKESDKKAIIDWWNRWLDTSTVDMVKEIKNQSSITRLIDQMASSKGRMVNWYESFIASALGVDPSYDTSAAPSNRADEYREYVEHYRHRLLFQNLINLLWIGTDSEKEEAKAMLRKEVGQDYFAPKDWAIWWRKNYDSVKADTP